MKNSAWGGEEFCMGGVKNSASIPIYKKKKIQGAIELPFETASYWNSSTVVFQGLNPGNDYNLCIQFSGRGEFGFANFLDF
jgi:hypothetical protein